MRNLLMLLFALALSSCIKEGTSGVELEPGDSVPEFAVVMNDGSTLSSADLKGAVSLVMFFHTGCPDCQQALPRVQQIYEEFQDTELRFALISREEEASRIESYWEEHQFTLPYSAQPDRRVYELFARERIPRIYINDKNGIIRAVFTDNPVPEYSDLKEAIDSSF